MVRHVLDQAERLLHELGLGDLIKMWARRVGSAIMMAHHNLMKLFASSLLLSPWVGAVVAACLVTFMVMATLLVTDHGVTNQLQFLD